MFVGLLLLAVLASRSRAEELVSVAVAAGVSASALGLLPPNLALLSGALAGATAAAAARLSRPRGAMNGSVVTAILLGAAVTVCARTLPILLLSRRPLPRPAVLWFGFVPSASWRRSSPST